ncbi:hypothetical protein I553_5393 [Mycobacterium xenopi 4042]|uniref:Uncharacterized protein n=1 Tax=Mycobacterium xenopi 4042 TaxID=1299334 RepID=X7ZXI3_MYCXE|nr:hypothetical protein I553_5393 [Mycobacterium xenopi 4042]
MRLRSSRLMFFLLGSLAHNVFDDWRRGPASYAGQVEAVFAQLM